MQILWQGEKWRWKEGKKQQQLLYLISSKVRGKRKSGRSEFETATPRAHHVSLQRAKQPDSTRTTRINSIDPPTHAMHIPSKAKYPTERREKEKKK
ncbi:hypothetical protein B9Z19DRAFT_742510 [Tuber borchii]|uniref:Uncharacterized protein n=1 Tax=Tuber borchii TaxID=42251 RepID=A0A2T6ZXZ7_TUBBO|nr:hypothetical protein B9Z19DRAFT_742510 [Tuber borchii]